MSDRIDFVRLDGVYKWENMESLGGNMKNKMRKQILCFVLAAGVMMSDGMSLNLGAAQEENTVVDMTGDTLSENTVSVNTASVNTVEATGDTATGDVVEKPAEAEKITNFTGNGCAYVYGLDLKTTEQEAWYYFVADDKVSGIFASGSNDPKGKLKITIYEEQGDKLKEVDYYEKMNALFCCRFENTKTYYLKVQLTRDIKEGETPNYSFQLRTDKTITGLSVSEYPETIKVGDKMTVTVSCTPEDTEYKALEDAERLSDSVYGRWSFKQQGKGEAYRTYTFRSTQAGKIHYKIASTYAKDVSCEITCTVVGPVAAGEKLESLIRDQEKVAKKTEPKMYFYEFVPPITDEYTFYSRYSKAKQDTYGILYNEDCTQIIEEDNDIGKNESSEYDTNFKFTCTLEAGKTYYLACEADEETEALDTIIGVTGATPYTPPTPPAPAKPNKPVDDSKTEMKNDETQSTEVAATAIKLDFKKLTLARKRKFTLQATMEPANTTDTITWTSSNPKYVSVDQNGKVTAKKKGKSAVITATTSSGVKATCKVKVPKKEIKSTKVTVSKKKITLSVGKTKKIKAKMSPSKTTDNKFYSSSNPQVATVSSTGVITAVAPGKTKVTVKTTSKKKVKITVVVK